MDDFEKLTEVVKKKIPDFEVRYKANSLVQKAIGKILSPFNDGYMTRYITTFYPYVYWPDKESLDEDRYHAFETLAHEFVHLMDTKNHPFWFRFSYLFPQILGIIFPFLSLLAIWFTNLWLISLVSLVFIILPLPSPWRAKWEYRGFAMSMAVCIWQGQFNIESKKAWIAERFTGSDYFYMWPFRKSVKGKLDIIEDSIHDSTVMDKSEAYKDVFMIVRDSE